VRSLRSCCTRRLRTRPRTRPPGSPGQTGSSTTLMSVLSWCPTISPCLTGRGTGRPSSAPPVFGFMEWRRSPVTVLTSRLRSGAGLGERACRCTIPADSASTVFPLRWLKQAPQRGVIHMTARDEKQEPRGPRWRVLLCANCRSEAESRRAAG
jgi:hypothetical protein